MNVSTDSLSDSLELLGVGAGIFLVLAALGTIAGAPWAIHASIGSAIIQVVGAVLMAVVGAGLAYVSWTGRE